MSISNGRGSGPAPGATGPTDSAGVPWAGRSFAEHDPAFEDDDGSADPAVLAAITAVHEGASQAGVVEALRRARLLVPLVAAAGDIGSTPEGRTVDKTQELSIVTVAGPDGRNAMPVFTSAEAMRRWDRAARPVPAETRRIAMAAASEQTQLVVIDPTAESEFVLRRPAVWALGQDTDWVPCFEDPEVADAFAHSIADESAVVRVGLAPGDQFARFAGAELVVILVLRPGLAEEDLHAIVGRLQERWVADPIIAERVDSMSVSLRSA